MVGPESEGVIHVEFNRMRGHSKPCDLLHLEVDVGIDHAVAKDATAGEELAILVEIIEGHVE